MRPSDFFKRCLKIYTHFYRAWNGKGQDLETFEDVRVIQAHLKNVGINLTKEADKSSARLECITFIDPGGNNILMDQHI